MIKKKIENYLIKSAIDYGMDTMQDYIEKSLQNKDVVKKLNLFNSGIVIDITKFDEKAKIKALEVLKKYKNKIKIS